MLAHLRKRAADILAQAERVTLATTGGAGIQAREFPCETHGMMLYLLLPATSDQLLNLEQDAVAVVTTSGWQLRGTGRILPLDEGPDALLLPKSPLAAGCVLVEIRPFRLQINHQYGWGFSETIDIDANAF